MSDQAGTPLQPEPSSSDSDSEIRQLEKSSRIIAETASDAIITIDQDSTILFVNRATEKIFGYSRKELLGHRLTMLMPDYLRRVHEAGIKRYSETRKRHIDWEAVALPGLHKSGREIPLELSFGEFTEGGKHYFTGIARDITDRKQFEKRLAAQFQVSRILADANSLIEATPRLLQSLCESLDWGLGILWRVDHDQNILRYVQSWRLPPAHFEEFEAASLNRTFDPGIGLPGRIWTSGKPIWLEDAVNDANFPRAPFAARAGIRSAFGFPIKLGNDVLGVIEFFSRDRQEPDRALLDVLSAVGNQIGQFIERKRAEDERTLIIEQEQSARRAAEAANQRIRTLQIVTDATLAHFDLDELLAELLDRIRDVLRVDTVAILLLEEGELVAWAAKGLEEEVELAIRIPMGKGFAGRVAETAQPINIEDTSQADLYNPILREKGIKSLLGVPLLVEGRVIGVIHVGSFSQQRFTEDDTSLLQLVADRIALAIDNARLYEEERTARIEAEAANRAKDEFLTILSHELRTPLTPIIGWLHMMLRGVLPQTEYARGLSVIDRNSQTLKRLINDLLDMSAILSGKMRIEETPVPLEAVVREAVETVRPQAIERDIHLEVTFRDWENPILVKGDRTRLVQTFWNLLTNAVKFSPAGGVVQVLCVADPDEVVIEIQDKGEGIAPDFLAHVFERFRQADGSKTRTHGGLGLGLALVKSFVEAHGGTTEVQSDGPGLGSKFTVRLPRPPATVTPAPPEAIVEDATVLATAHLLIVEDAPDTLEMMHATMTASGYRSTLCASAAMALEAVATQQFDLIISDIGMPVMDGYELITRLRQNPRFRYVPAIAVSGYASQKDMAAAIAAGYDVHLAKPVAPEELIALVEKLLKQKRDDNRIDSA